MNYIDKARVFRMSNPIDPFDKYYKITETRVDGLTVWIQRLNEKLSHFLNHDPIRAEITEIREYVKKIKELHENIFAEYQKQAKEIEEIWKILKKGKYD